ncbi:MAG: polysaccharide deacetylase family protein [Syntrophaceae bacterium]|nr:polysaccharide deacetylase family protein [Syntrophaceae bacterium]
MKIIQTWDDGPVSDIRLTEILRRYQARATFCLTPGLYQENRSFGWVHEDREVWRLSFHELTTVYGGFEICSHSMTHPYLTDLSTEQLNWELQTSRRILEETFQKPVTGFCYPFNAYNDVVKDAVRRAGYRWARGNRPQDRVYPPADPLEFTPCCHFLDRDFWKKYDLQKNRNDVFFFWGHSYELLDDAMWTNFEDMIREIASDPEAQWCFASDLLP